ncbi:MAG TPA: tRNA (adenosine(37)-N6)-dimethylallyltransferase MiaA [Dehalococcoidia bacterium]|nr:tRNA (adenosine(37)-N6)-dimethylallyltransferase MiaA [Dehalococcoidia bacterium]
MNELIAIVGPTGVGKSHLAIKLSQNFNGEIVSADSRQVYRHMDIGTAKPNRHDMALVRHHLVDIINPDEPFSLAQYQGLANNAIKGIFQRNKVPFLVGGSGQYVRAVLEGWGIPQVPPDTDLRRDLEEKANGYGVDELYRELRLVDPAAAGRIDRNNPRRLIRALEITRGSNKNTAGSQSNKTPPFRHITIGLTRDRDELYRRIDARVDRMIEHGLVEEVKKLINMGYGMNLPSMSGIGYRQIGMYLEGNITLETAVQQIKFESHRFVRQQYNWFSPKDDRIRWFDMGGRAGREIAALVADFTGIGL